MSAPTPGPWHVGAGNDRLVFSAAIAKPVAVCTSKANAAQIAALPELLAELRWIVAYNRNGIMPRDCREWLTRADAALAKAER